MRKYRKYDWSTLFEEFEQSGLNQTEFCKQKEINPKYFCQKRNEAKDKCKKPFARVTIQPPSAGALSIEIGRCKIICPDSMSLQSFTNLVQTLA